MGRVKPFKLPKADVLPAMNWRDGEHPEVSKIEKAPVTCLHDGLKAGGTFYRDGLKLPGAPHSRTFSRKERASQRSAEGVELQKKYESLMKSCRSAQKETRALFSVMCEKSTTMRHNMSDVDVRLQIMRSMPDLTVSPEDFEQFVDNVLGQPKLQPTQQVQTTGSLQHIFPVRDWKNSGKVKVGAGSK
ncbi:unnamed protein product [Amoebophrya sp. A25]|nr:unnamed protein product [Amoebophrya sp. A25]|eukprot:GSA25T00006630001.1